jgi:large subunit ribosomal protein L4
LLSALSDRAADDKVIVVSDWNIDEPKTKEAIKLLAALGLRPEGERAPRVLVVLFPTEENVWKSLRNLGERVKLVLPGELNTYDVLVSDYVVFSSASLDSVVARLGNGSQPEVAASDEAEDEAADEAEDEVADEAEAGDDE